MNIKEKIRNIPNNSGVYLFKDEFKRIIYIGKANNLRNRVCQYFHGSIEKIDERHKNLRQSIMDVDYIIVNSPWEALVLEADLIRRHRPFFNIRLKDDKRYPSIEITVYEKYPRMRFVRRPINKKSRYFGPYPNSRALRQTFKLIQKAFNIRTCKYDLKNPLSRPCLDFYINLCPAPCTGNISVKEYKKRVKNACNFLDGKSESLINQLKKELNLCSNNLEFERCIFIRDLLKSIEYVISKKPLLTKIGDDADFIGLARGKTKVAIALLQLRNGKIHNQLRYNVEAPLEEDDEEVIKKFIQQYYKRGFFIPPSIYVNNKVEDFKDIMEWLLVLGEKKILIKRPLRGKKREIMDIATTNALEYFKMEDKIRKERIRRNIEALEDVKEILSLREIPHRIEGFDISNISGKMAVSSMVVFIDGEPFKDDYRRFKIREKDEPDDFAMMEETINRRLKNLKLKEMESFKEEPDIILIDGGKGQLAAALKSVKRQNIKDLNVISLAKKEEEIFVPGRSTPLLTDPKSSGMRLLRRVRDEAHRFAVTYHRKLRENSIKNSILDEISGISQRRKEALLGKFGSIEDIRKASLYEIQEISGFNRKIAENVIKFFMEKNS